jgi:hypothetical protein
MKKSLIVILVLLGIGAATYIYFFQITPTSKLKTINVVPENALMIVDIEDPFEQWNTITQGKIWTYLKTNNYLSEIGNEIDSLNLSIKENKILWDLIASRPVTISVHEARNNDFDFLYIIDLTKAAQFSFVKDYLDKLVDNNIEVSKRDYHNYQIIELTFKDSHESLFLYFKKNLFIISTTHVLIEQSIDQRDEPVIARDLDYLEVSKLMDDDGVNIYLQHAYFKKYIAYRLSTEDNTFYEFIESLIYSGMNLSIDDQFLSLSGFSNFNDTLNSYAKILHNSGTGKMNIPEIVPENSMFFISMGFDSFSKFYQNLETRLEASSEGEEYFENKKKLEKYLDINVEDHLLSWIGDEAGVLQIHPTNSSKSNGYAVALKANDIEMAKEKLDFIKNQIRKKTPVKFKGIEYKGHQINFLSVKGFFKVLLGNMFSKLEKPYYTIIDDFVIFSNHPGTLAQLITYKLEGTTLSNNDQFNTYLDQFNGQSSLFFYINSKQIVPDSKEYLSTEYWEVMDKNKEYIENFPIMGLQIKPHGNLLATSIILNYMPKQEVVDWYQLFVPLPSAAIDTLVTEQPKLEEQISIDDIFPDDLTDKKLTDTYANGQIRFEVALAAGLKNGSYKEYDSLGNLTVKGRYKKNEKTGAWKYYNSEGDLIRKERY